MKTVLHRSSRVLFLAAWFGVLVLGPQTPSPLTITLLGDIMLGRGIASTHTGGGWEQVLSPLVPYTTRDELSIANLESPLTQAPLTRPAYDLRAPVSALQALTSASIDLLTLANNHMGDSGEIGIEDTRTGLREGGLITAGPDPKAVYITERGQKLAVLALDDITQPVDLLRASTEIHQAQLQADWVIVSVHWGQEYNPGVTNRQKRLAAAFASAGADLILGHHPHVLQPTAWVQSNSPTRPTFIAYSLGNAIFDQPTPPSTCLSAALQVVLDSRGVRQVIPIPFKIDWRKGTLMDADPEETQSIIEKLNVPSRP